MYRSSESPQCVSGHCLSPGVGCGVQGFLASLTTHFPVVEACFSHVPHHSLEGSDWECFSVGPFCCKPLLTPSFTGKRRGGYSFHFPLGYHQSDFPLLTPQSSVHTSLFPRLCYMHSTLLGLVLLLFPCYLLSTSQTCQCHFFTTSNMTYTVILPHPVSSCQFTFF